MAQHAVAARNGERALISTCRRLLPELCEISGGGGCRVSAQALSRLVKLRGDLESRSWMVCTKPAQQIAAWGFVLCLILEAADWSGDQDIRAVQGVFHWASESFYASYPTQPRSQGYPQVVHLPFSCTARGASHGASFNWQVSPVPNFRSITMEEVIRTVD